MVKYLEVDGLYGSGGLTCPGDGDSISTMRLGYFKEEAWVGGDVRRGRYIRVGGDGREEVISYGTYSCVINLIEEEEVVGVFGEGGVEAGEFVGGITAEKDKMVKGVVN